MCSFIEQCGNHGQENHKFNRNTFSNDYYPVHICGPLQSHFCLNQIATAHIHIHFLENDVL